MPVRPDSAAFNIVRASHVELGVRDLGASRAFYVDCLGYIVTDEDTDALYLRGVEERNHHSLVLRKSNARGARARLQGRQRRRPRPAPRWFARKGCRVVAETCRSRAARCAPSIRSACRSISISRWIAPSDAAEIRRATAARASSASTTSTASRRTCRRRYEFYTELGFRLTEYTETDGADPKLWAVWMHRKGNVHDLAFTNGRGPRLHHVGVWMPTRARHPRICAT